MRIFKWNKNSQIHFTARSHTKRGIVSAVIGLVTVAGFMATSIFSANNKGNGGIILGLIGLDYGPYPFMDFSCHIRR